MSISMTSRVLVISIAHDTTTILKVDTNRHVQQHLRSKYALFSACASCQQHKYRQVASRADDVHMYFFILLIELHPVVMFSFSQALTKERTREYLVRSMCNT